MENLEERLNALKGKVTGWDATLVNSLLHQNKIAKRNSKTLKLSPRQINQIEEIEKKTAQLLLF